MLSDNIGEKREDGVMQVLFCVLFSVIYQGLTRTNTKT